MVVTEAELLLVDEKGSCIETLQHHVEGPCCVANWSEGFVVGGVNGVAIYRHEEKGYMFKHTIEIGDKELSVKSISVYDDKIALLLNNGVIMQTKIKT